MAYEQLQLDNQLCFPVYAASRLITRAYQPHLDRLGITYPQYLVLMVLWEADSATVNKISQKLILQTNTVTPLLKRMEKQGLVTRRRSESDERKVIVTLTGKGRRMQTAAAHIPLELGAALVSEGVGAAEISVLKRQLSTIIDCLNRDGR